MLGAWLQPCCLFQRILLQLREGRVNTSGNPDIRNYLAATILLAVLIGCSTDRGPVETGSRTDAGQASPGDASFGVLPRKARGGFADLPDRGELLSYDHVRRIKRSGAYTAYPVALSEEHALNAMRSSEMMINSPDGGVIRLRYERHVEHPDGNWSWIGRNAEGADAVLTFGDKAVFGVIPQGNSDILRLKMFAGQSYLVTANRSKLTGDEGLSHLRGTDLLIPPNLSAQPASGPTTASMNAEPATASTNSAVVDVLLGYTSGFAAQLGGDAQANTRLFNLIDVTNQAYSNSGINMRMRLVKTLQVNYPDNTNGGATLEALTGYKSGAGGGPIAPDPAFNALRAARDTYGADLVSLVRVFRTPENDGCGIAWLNGGGQVNITTSSAPFGYSVVSDGSDFDEGDSKTYFCHEETLAHELGHNMGQTHNVEDSSQPGTHAYSYGYREASASGFYTVMSYRIKDSSQFSIRHFANPAISYAGRPTGVNNSADNARSLNITMPVVAQFRASVVMDPVTVPALIDQRKFDFNGDGRSDLIWRTEGNTDWAYWTMNGATKSGGVGYSVGPAWRIVATGDFQGDGKLDLIWTDGSSMQMWQGNGGGFIGAAMRSYPAGWRVVAVGDIDNDGKSDLLWRDDANTLLSTWLMSGTTIVGSSAYSVPPPWSVVGTGDLSGDGRLDIIWTNGSLMQLWVGGPGQAYFGAAMQSYPSGWDLVGVGDVDGDGKADLLWRHLPSGQIAYWRMSGAARVDGIGFLASPAWRPIQVADFSGDGRTDIVWTNGVNMQMWVSTGAGFRGESMVNYPAGWNSIRR